MRNRFWLELRLVLRRAVRLVTFRRVASHPAPTKPRTLLAVFAVFVTLSVALDILAAGTDYLEFNEYGLADVLASWGAILLGLMVAAGRAATPRFSRAVSDIASIWCLVVVIHIVMFTVHLAAGLGNSAYASWGWWALAWAVFAYALVAMWRAGRSLWSGQLRFPGLRLAAISLLPLLLVPEQPIVYGARTEWSRTDVFYLSRKAYAYVYPSEEQYYAGDYEAEPSLLEDTLYRQAGLLTGTLGAIMPSDDTKPEYFFLAAAPNGWQDVFASEVTKAKQIFDERFGTRGHSAVLITSIETRETVPLANTKNIEVALQEIGKLMDRDNDVLVLYITSHGSVGKVSVYLEGHALNQITPDSLARALDDARIKNRVLIISACHSGSFIPRLENPDTLIMTAARTDRTSFGCANGREWTYFGDALFNNALREEKDFVKAFDKARVLIEKWEFWRVLLLQGRSEPQISVGAEIVKVLARMPGAEDQRAAAVIDELRPVAEQ